MSDTYLDRQTQGYPVSPHFLSKPNYFLARLEPIESLIAIVGILVIISTFRAFLQDATDDANETGNLLNQLVTFGVSAASIAMAVIMGIPRWLRAVLLRGWPVLVFTALAVVSVAWSIEPGTTFRRGAALILSTAFTLYLVARFSTTDLFKLLFAVAACFVVLGYLAVLVPGQGITPNGILAGTWRGFTGQKNEFGRVLAILIGFSLIAWHYRVLGKKLPWLAIALMALPLLVLSDSKTPMAGMLVAVTLLVPIAMLSMRQIGPVRITGGVSMLVLITGGVVGIILTIIVLPIILDALGRDLTFSGRINLWEYVFALSEKRQWLGAGFRAFWTESNRTFFFEHFWWRVVGESRAPYHSHSSYIDVYAEFGWLGVTILCVFIASAIRTIYRCFVEGCELEAAMLAFMFVFNSIFSFTERSFLQYFDPVWFFLFLTYMQAHRALHFARLEAIGRRSRDQRTPT